MRFLSNILAKAGLIVDGTSTLKSDVAVNGKLSIGTLYPGLGQYIIADGGAGTFDFVNSSGGGFSYRWIQNGGTAMTLSTQNNLLVGTTTDAGYKLDVNGSARVGTAGLYGTNGTYSGNLIKFNTSNLVEIDGSGYGAKASSNFTIAGYNYTIGRISTDSYVNAKGGSSTPGTTFVSYGIGRPDTTNQVARLGGFGGVYEGTYWFNGLALAFFVSSGTDISGGNSIVEKMRLKATGDLQVVNLAGSGSRMVVADSSGILSTQSIPSFSLGSLSATAPISYNSSTGAFSISQASGSSNGYLSSTDWTTFNNKVNTADLSAYMPLSGGTLTGTVNGTNAVFTSAPAFNSSGNTALYSSLTMSVPASSTFTNGGTWSASANSNIITYNGSSTINNGATMAGFVAVNRTAFNNSGYTITLNQSTGIRAIAAFQVLQQTAGSNNGTVTHGASMFIQGIYPAGTANVTYTNYYGMLINPLDEWGNVTLTNRWGIYQAGDSDKNYFAGQSTFNSSITASSIVKSGGTSAQILMADGSVLTAGTNITISGGTISSSGGGGSYLPLSGGTLTGQLASTSTAPIAFQGNGNTGTYNATVIYGNYNNTSGDDYNGIFIERGRLSDSPSAEIRKFVIGGRGGAVQWKVDGSGNTYQSGTLSMATSGTSYIRMGQFPNVTTNSGEAWIGRASDRSTGSMTVQLGSANSSFFEIVDYGWTTVTLKAGMNDFSYKGNAVLHAGNYSSYALPLSGGTISGGLTVTGTSTFNNNISITPVSAAWAEGISFNMPTTSAWGGLRWLRGRSGYDGNWAIGYTGLDSSDDFVFVAQNGGTQVNNILRMNKAGYLSTSTGNNSYHYFGPNASWGGSLYVGATPNKIASLTAQVVATDGSLHVDSATDKPLYLNYFSNQTIYVRGNMDMTGYSITASSNVYTSGWFRNYGAQGMYNQDYNNHWYATDGGTWNIGGTNGSWARIAFRPQGHQSTVRGYVFSDTSNNIGFLNSNGNWNLRVNNDGNTYLDLNYGISIVGVYSAARYQGVWAMGDAYKLAVDGTGTGNLYGLAWSHPNAGGQAGYLSNHGLIHMMYGTAFATISDTIWCRGDITAYSDIRVKENIEVIDNAIEKINSIRGVTFTRNDIENKEKRFAGVIAQEVLNVLPEVITENTSNGHYSVSYGNLNALTIEGIKEHDKVIKAQAIEIQKLKERIDELTK